MTCIADQCRLATAVDRIQSETIEKLIDIDGAIVAVLEQDSTVIAAAGLDPRGTAVTPNEPVLILGMTTTLAHDEALLKFLFSHLPTPKPARVLAMCDPLDAAGLACLDALGFKPAGVMPYFELGGGIVDYVSGYRDATGSVLELARPI